jgi:hypothetical protein
MAAVSMSSILGIDDFKAVKKAKGTNKGKQYEKHRRCRYRYGLEEVAKLIGLSYEATKKMVQRGKLDPFDLESVCRLWAERQGMAQVEPPAPGLKMVPPVVPAAEHKDLTFMSKPSGLVFTTTYVNPKDLVPAPDWAPMQAGKIELSHSGGSWSATIIEGPKNPIAVDPGVPVPF